MLFDAVWVVGRSLLKFLYFDVFDTLPNLKCCDFYDVMDYFLP